MENGSEYKIDPVKIGKNKTLALVALALGLIIVVGLVYYFTKINQAYSSTSHEMKVTIVQGATTTEIAKQLTEEKIIGSPWIFIIYARLSGASGKIEAGEYALNSNMPITELVETLTHGRVISSERTVTIPEGWNNAQIAAYLADRQIITQAADFKSALATGQFNFKFASSVKNSSYQGYLFPDTYLVGKTEGSSVLIQKMLTNFESKITPQMLTDIQASGKNLSDVIILASIIEKEVGRNKDNITQVDLDTMQQERKLVASVFYNRLEVNHALESDATVNYVFDKTGGIPTLAQVKTQSPYNTYLNIGLPPGPIANPGIGSIMAAIYPADSDYFYFINKADGEAVFAKTLAEHNANKTKYLHLE